jgi:APA family basic amino acid/polyamine antiporter
VISAIISWFWAYTSVFTVIVGAFGQIITLGIGCLAASLIPYKQKDLYATSPIAGYLGRLPKLTIIGLLGALGALLMVLNMARDPFSGVDVNASPVMFWVSIGMFPLGIALYYLSGAVRRREGVNLGLAFREIPPE